MFQKLFSIVALSALLANFAFANDLLARLSNGAVSDNSVGVKILSLDEMKEVRGGIKSCFCTMALHTIEQMKFTQWQNILKGNCNIW